jgi:thymidylate synthase (FAD)|tara:strand:+ start:615 stop:1238 length:624 start_codon:yes stop_codon:yes gene_type:complete
MHNAKLVWITPDAEKLIGKIARVSNPNNEDNPNVGKLIQYLIKHKHWSPFEMASMCVEIKTTRAIAPQILRHRSFSFQEFSQRYAVATEINVPDLRRQDLKNRQNSIDDLPAEKVDFLQQQIDNHYRSALDIYQTMLDTGVAKECARSVLPLSTATRLYMSGTIRSWLHYVDLRGANGTQLEHMQIARQIGDILAGQVPTIARAMWD